MNKLLYKRILLQLCVQYYCNITHWKVDHAHILLQNRKRETVKEMNSLI